MPEPLNPVVVPREACRKGFTPADCIDVNEHDEPTCVGCLGDGTRVLLDQAQEVEQLDSPFVVRRQKVEPGEGDNGGDTFTSLVARRDGWYPVEVDR